MKNMVKPRITSFQNASVLRKYTISFMIGSTLPLCVLFYIYNEIKEKGRFEITEGTFSVTLAFVALGTLVGFLVTRSIIKDIMNLSKANKETLEGILGTEKINELVDNNNEVAVLARSFSEITNRLEENVRNLELAKKTLHSVLSRVGEGISSMQNIDNFLALIVETVTQAMTAKTGVLLLLDDQKNELYVKTIYGMSHDSATQVRIKSDEGPFSIVFKTHKPLLLPKVGDNEYAIKEFGSLFETPVLCAPLLLRDKILGVISVSGRKSGGNFQEDELNLIFNLALQTAVAIENSRLNEDAEKTYFETISALAMAVEAKDKYSRGHLDRVSNYAMRIAEKLNLSDDDKKTLRDGARLHDIGKIGIIDEVLKKPGALNEQEWMMMKKHTEIGEGIIKPIRSLSRICDVVRHHHEKLDGSGYPDGLKGDEVSLLARILGVADIFDALTTDRPYRPAFTIDQAKEELIRMKGKLDPRVVDVFLGTL